MIAAAIIAAAIGGWNTFTASKLTPAHPDITPQIVHEAVDRGITPPEVILAVELIKKWEGFSNVAYDDGVGVMTFGCGETQIDGRPVRKSDYISSEDAEKRLIKRVTFDYYLPLVDKIPNFTKAPVGGKASMISLAYNIGTGSAKPKRGAIGSSSAADIARYDYEAACINLGKWNKAGGREFKGLTNRRGMGDPGRAGEGEICKSSLEEPR